MSKFVVVATRDDVPHLSPEQKAALWGSIPPYQRDARSKGIPQLGSGAIHPVPESEIVRTGRVATASTSAGRSVRDPPDLVPRAADRRRFRGR